MKNLFTFLALFLVITVHAQFNVTFKVDMAGQTISPNGVHLAGNFQGWNPASTLMTNAGGTIYQVTVPAIAAGVIEYKFVNGNAWGSDEIIPAACAQNGNRFTTISGMTILPTVGWQQCPPPPTYSVTFVVNMSGQTIGPNGVHLAGNFQGWDPATTAMTDIGGGLWSVTVPNISAGVIEYKFVNGNAWGNDETVPTACAQNSNRFATISATTTLPTVCFTQCGTCPPVYNVTFRVDMTGQTVSPNGVHIAGIFNGWNPSSVVMNNVGNGIWEKTLPVLGGVTEFKYINGIAWANEETVPTACAQNTNRFTTISSSTTLPTVCFSQCSACPPQFNVTFRVNMTGQTVSPNGVYLAGSFQNWNPSGTPMTSIGGGVWEKTVPVPAGVIEYKFINGNAWGSEETVPTACAQNTNRFTTISAINTLPTVCFSSCSACVTTITLSVASTTNVSCNGGSNGAATISATGCTPTYLWSNGKTTASISNLTAGQYTVSATCSGQTVTSTVTITQPNAIVLPTPTVQNIGCNSAGSISVSASGGTGSLSYVWSNNSTTPTISVTNAGTYTVTVSDGNACTKTASATVSGSQGLPNVQITNQNPTLGCTTPSIVLNATSSSSGNFTYNWSGAGIVSGGNTLNATVNAAGNYSIVVTNTANGCSNNAVINVASGGAVPTFRIQGNATLCPGDSTNLNVSNSFSSYNWSNGANTNSIKVKNAGIYTVTIVDGNGCSATQTKTVALSPLPVVNIPKDTLSCAKPTLVLNVTTTSNLQTTSWTGPNNYVSTVLKPTITSAGVYTLTVSTVDGCTKTFSTTIYENTGSSTVSIAGAGTFCNGQSTVLSVAPNLGTYLWNNGKTTNTVTASQSGTYTVTVTNASGCKKITSATVNISPSITVSAGADVKACEGKSLTLSATTTSTGLTYTWTGNNNFSYNKQDTTIQNVVLTNAGNYYLNATDGNGCTAKDTVKISVSPKMDVQLLATVDCNNQAKVISQITGGIANYSYSWSETNSTTSTTTIAVPATLILTVTDSYGCEQANSPSLTINANLPMLISASVAAVSDNGNGSVVIVVSNGTAPLKYAWSNGAKTKDLIDIEKGNYCVTITDGNGCVATDCFEIKSTVTIGTNDNSIADVIHIFPNPAQDIIQITTDGNLVLTKIELFDSTGKLLQTTSGDVKQIDIQALPNALYLVKCSTNGGFALKRILKL